MLRWLPRLAIAFLTGCGLAPADDACLVQTGERDYHVDVLQPPPPRVRAGDAVEVRFTGGYYDVFPACLERGGRQTYHYPTIDELADVTRTVDVLLDGAPIHSQECAYDCDLLFQLPDSLSAGDYILILRPRSWLYQPRETKFTITVAARE